MESNLQLQATNFRANNPVSNDKTSIDIVYCKVIDISAVVDICE